MKHIRITPQIARLKKQYDKIVNQMNKLVVVSDYDRLLYKIMNEKKNVICEKMNKLIGSEYYDFKNKIIVIY